MPVLITGALLAWASGATNFTRLVLGESNYGTDPAPTADIVLQNDEYISNSSDGTISFGAANLTTTGTITGTAAGTVGVNFGSLAIGTPTMTPAVGSMDVQGSIYARGNAQCVNANVVALAVGTPTRTPAAGVSDIQGDVYSRGAIYSPLKLVACTENANVDAELLGAVYTNAGASATVELTLPTAVAGLRFTFADVTVGTDVDLVIVANTGDKINGGTAAKKYECTTDAVKQAVSLVARDATDWIIISEVGTWANNND